MRSTFCFRNLTFSTNHICHTSLQHKSDKYPNNDLASCLRFLALVYTEFSYLFIISSDPDLDNFSSNSILTILLLIDWIVFYAVSAIFQLYNVGDHFVFHSHRQMLYIFIFFFSSHQKKCES